MTPTPRPPSSSTGSGSVTQRPRPGGCLATWPTDFGSEVTIEGVTVTQPGATSRTRLRRLIAGRGHCRHRHAAPRRLQGQQPGQRRRAGRQRPVEPAGQTVVENSTFDGVFQGVQVENGGPLDGLRQHVPEPAEPRRRAPRSTAARASTFSPTTADCSTTRWSPATPSPATRAGASRSKRIRRRRDAPRSHVQRERRAATITGNTFHVDRRTAAPAPTVSVGRDHAQRRKLSTDTLDATLGDNTGTVVSPVATINEPGSGTVERHREPGSPNTIVPQASDGGNSRSPRTSRRT